MLTTCFFFSTMYSQGLGFRVYGVLTTCFFFFGRTAGEDGGAKAGIGEAAAAAAVAVSFKDTRGEAGGEREGEGGRVWVSFSARGIDGVWVQAGDAGGRLGGEMVWEGEDGSRVGEV